MKKLLVYWLTVMMVACPLIACSLANGEDTPLGDGDGAGATAASLAIGDYIQLGKYADIPVVWRCVDIDENGMLMLSDKTLCEKKFGLSNYWAESALRRWLNSDVPEGEEEWIPVDGDDQWGLSDFDWRDKKYNREKGFLHPDNFTLSERAAMKAVTQWTMLPEKHLDLTENGEAEAYNPVKDWTPGKGLNEPGGAICYDISELPDVFTGAAHRLEDTVFLLDEMQLYHFWNNFGGTREAVATTYVQEMYENPRAYWTPYFLRTPSLTLCIRIGSSGGYGQFSCFSASGIRPAFYLNEAAAQILSGSGTEEDPYIIDGISVYCDEEELSFDVPPIKEDDRVLVPMRKIFEVLGASVDWDGETNTVTAIKGKTEISLEIGSNVMLKNGKKIELDVPAKVINDRTLVPIRAVSEGLGARVEWDEKKQAVWIWTD